MFFLISYFETVSFYEDCKAQTRYCSSDEPCVFSVSQTSGFRKTFLYFFEDLSGIEIRYASKYISLDDDPDKWDLVPSDKDKNFWIMDSSLSVYIKPSTRTSITARGGKTMIDTCQSGTFVTSKSTFDLNEYRDKLIAAENSNFCIIFVHNRGTLQIPYSILNHNIVKYREGNQIKDVTNPDKILEASSWGPIYLSITLKNQKQRNLFKFSIENTHILLVTKEILDYSNGLQQAEMEKETSTETVINEDQEISSVSTSTTNQPDSIDIATAKPTWDGLYDDPPNIIIRGEDIPQVIERQPPLQTNYVRTDVPKGTVVINATIATILIVIISIFTIINIIRTAKNVRKKGQSSSASEIDFEFTESEVYITDETPSNPFELN